MISNFLHYQFALASRLFKRDIDFLTWRYAAWNRPVVVCGRRGAWVVDSTFDMTNAGMRVSALVQVFVGVLMIAGAMGSRKKRLTPMRTPAMRQCSWIWPTRRLKAMKGSSQSVADSPTTEQLAA